MLSRMGLHGFYCQIRWEIQLKTLQFAYFYFLYNALKFRNRMASIQIAIRVRLTICDVLGPAAHLEYLSYQIYETLPHTNYMEILMKKWSEKDPRRKRHTRLIAYEVVQL